MYINGEIIIDLPQQQLLHLQKNLILFKDEKAFGNSIYHLNTKGIPGVQSTIGLYIIRVLIEYGDEHEILCL